MGYGRDELKVTFDEVADLYDRARPTYSAALFEDLAEMAGLSAASRIVEVGCGTGQATLPLARLGAQMTCVEPGPNLGAIARRNLASFPSVQVVTGTFEDVPLESRSFDLVFAATSWHWVDPAVRYAKAADVLRSGGHLAIVTTTHAFPTDFDLFFADLNDVYEAIRHDADKRPWPRPLPDELPDESGDILRSGFWSGVTVRRYLWVAEYTGEAFVDVLSTYSDHRLMDAERRDFLFSEVRRLARSRPGGVIRKHYLTMLHVAPLANPS